jgi:hypothetical protein
MPSSAKLFIALLTILIAETAATSAQLPRFEDYPVTDILKGTPAAPIFATAEQGRFRGLINDGVTPQNRSPT